MSICIEWTTKVRAIRYKRAHLPSRSSSHVTYGYLPCFLTHCTASKSMGMVSVGREDGGFSTSRESLQGARCWLKTRIWTNHASFRLWNYSTRPTALQSTLLTVPTMWTLILQQRKSHFGSTRSHQHFRYYRRGDVCLPGHWPPGNSIPEDFHGLGKVA